MHMSTIIDPYPNGFRIVETVDPKFLEMGVAAAYPVQQKVDFSWIDTQISTVHGFAKAVSSGAEFRVLIPEE